MCVCVCVCVYTYLHIYISGKLCIYKEKIIIFCLCYPTRGMIWVLFTNCFFCGMIIVGNFIDLPNF